MRKVGALASVFKLGHYPLLPLQRPERQLPHELDRLLLQLSADGVGLGTTPAQSTLGFFW